jgi:hypothetical protein
LVAGKAPERLLLRLPVLAAEELDVVERRRLDRPHDHVWLHLPVVDLGSLH